MDTKTESTRIDALESGRINSTQFRKVGAGWQWWCQKDGPPSNRWVTVCTLREALDALVDQADVMDAAVKAQAAAVQSGGSKK